MLHQSVLLATQGLSDHCKAGYHVDCNDCMCRCHIPGTIENLAKNIAKLDRKRPGIGETL
ncbi:MAG: hypothetical protein M3136_12030 [Thermoproteota archaeon]|nr:hypothetical protein [Thermoproteota archaeon]